MGQRLEGERAAFRGLVTSRKPDDLQAFCEKAVEEICEGRHEEQARQAQAASAA